MKQLITKTIPLWIASLMALSANAQISTNPDKFLGNITTNGTVNPAGIPKTFHEVWNQITPENGSKWETVQRSGKNSWDWTECDNAYNDAKNNGYPFKFHTFIWGSQYPSWLSSMTDAQRYDAIVAWMDAAKERYPDIQLIDVVNEAVTGHAPFPYKTALGGDGATGYDWIIKSFEMVHERWPDAILIYNDYNTFQWQKNEFIKLVKTIRDAGAPIDAYGMQSHDLGDINVNTFKSAMDEIQEKLQMPMYITEYDISKENDNQQKQKYEEQIPYMWEADYCAGITLWGWVYGATWNQAPYSGLYKNGVARPAMDWLKEYMQTDKAKTAKSPFPGMTKEASVYIKPASTKPNKDEELSITVKTRLKTKTVASVDVYINNVLHQTLTSAPYVATYTPTATGAYTVKAVVKTTDETTYERVGGFTAVEGSGINAIVTDKQKNAPAYNLQGQQVNADYKGVVIINGKKVINK